jgi:hypothetical protein
MMHPAALGVTRSNRWLVASGANTCAVCQSPRIRVGEIVARLTGRSESARRLSALSYLSDASTVTT